MHSWYLRAADKSHELMSYCLPFCHVNFEKLAEPSVIIHVKFSLYLPIRPMTNDVVLQTYILCPTSNTYSHVVFQVSSHIQVLARRKSREMQSQYKVNSVNILISLLFFSLFKFTTLLLLTLLTMKNTVYSSFWFLRH